MSPEPGTLQRRLGEALFARVAGPNGPANRARFATPGPRWFAPDRPIRRVHGDAAMFPGGLRALLLQSLHPQAMIAVAQHSDYRNDPWRPAAADQHLPRRHHLRRRRRRAARGQPRPARPSPHNRHRYRRPPLPGRRPAPAPLGARGRDRQLPPLPPALRRAAARRGRLRRLRRRHRQDRRRSRGAGPAADARRAGRGARRLPARAARDARGTRGSPVPGLEPAATAARPRPVHAAGSHGNRGTSGLGAARTAAAPAPGGRVRDRTVGRPRHRRHDPLGDGRPPLAGYRSRVTTASACASVTGIVSSLIGTVLYPPSRKIS